MRWAGARTAIGLGVTFALAAACKREPAATVDDAAGATTASSTVSAASPSASAIDPTASPEERGRFVYAREGCDKCHSVDGACDAKGASMLGLFGQVVALADGTVVLADDDFFRESLLNPGAKVTDGFDAPSKMPTYDLPASDVAALIAYVKSLDAAAAVAAARASAPAPDAGRPPQPVGPAVHRVRAFIRGGCSVSVNGRLPPEVIERIFRQNMG